MLLVLFFVVVVATFSRGGAPLVLPISDKLLLLRTTRHRIRLQVGDLAIDAVVARAWRLLMLIDTEHGALARSKAEARG